MDNIKLSIITVPYNSEKVIEWFLDLAFKNLPKWAELILVDNASTDNTSNIATKLIFERNMQESVKLLQAPANLGFSKGCNIGAKVARGEYLLFLNPDASFDSNSLLDMLSFYEKTDDAGLVAPKLITDNGETQTSVKNFPTLKRAFQEYFLNKKHVYTEYAPEGDSPVVIESVYGAAMLIKKDLFEALNGFNEKFFVYYEDTDLCLRLSKMGKKVYYLPNVTLTHKVGKGSDVKSSKLYFPLSVIALFIPIKGNGRQYIHVQGRNRYHGFLISFLIALIMYVTKKLRIYKG